MRTLERFDIRLPSYSLNYLVNNDPSGLSPKDKELIDAFMAPFYEIANDRKAHVLLHTDEEEYFTWKPPFGLACNVVDAVIKIVK